MSELGKNIRRFRVQMNMTQEELAQKIITSRTTVSNYENGRTQPDIDMLVTISEVLETDPGTLITGSEKKTQVNIKPWIIMAGTVMTLWLLIIMQVNSNLFEDGFGMYWMNLYQSFLKYILIFMMSFCVTVIIKKNKRFTVSFHHQKFAFGVLICFGALFLASGIIAMIAFTHYFGSTAPLYLHREWSGFTNDLFRYFSLLYRNRDAFVFFMLYGMTPALILPEQKQV